jgi:chromate reductase
MSSSSKSKVILFMGSTRSSEKMGPFPGRVCDRVTLFIKNKLESTGLIETIIVDPRDPLYHFDHLSLPFHWAKMLKKPISPNLQRLYDVVNSASGYVFITPEYNFTVAPALVNLIDHLPPTPYGGKMALKPSLLVSYSMGKFGGTRALVSMRSLVSEIGTVTCSNTFSVAEAHLSLSENGEEIVLDQKAGKVLTDAFAKCSKEFIFVLEALNVARNNKNVGGGGGGKL